MRGYSEYGDAIQAAHYAPSCGRDQEEFWSDRIQSEVQEGTMLVICGTLSVSFPSGRPYLPEAGKEHVTAQTDDESPNVATTAIPLESGEGTHDQADRDQVIV
jgi:hypothetical protein